MFIGSRQIFATNNFVTTITGKLESVSEFNSAVSALMWFTRSPCLLVFFIFIRVGCELVFFKFFVVFCITFSIFRFLIIFYIVIINDSL